MRAQSSYTQHKQKYYDTSKQNQRDDEQDDLSRDLANVNAFKNSESNNLLPQAGQSNISLGGEDQVQMRQQQLTFGNQEQQQYDSTHQLHNLPASQSNTQILKSRAYGAENQRTSVSNLTNPTASTHLPQNNALFQQQNEFISSSSNQHPDSNRFYIPTAKFAHQQLLSSESLKDQQNLNPPLIEDYDVSEQPQQMQQQQLFSFDENRSKQVVGIRQRVEIGGIRILGNSLHNQNPTGKSRIQTVRNASNNSGSTTQNNVNSGRDDGAYSNVVFARQKNKKHIMRPMTHDKTSSGVGGMMIRRAQRSQHQLIQNNSEHHQHNPKQNQLRNNKHHMSEYSLNAGGSSLALVNQKVKVKGKEQSSQDEDIDSHDVEDAFALASKLYQTTPSTAGANYITNKQKAKGKAGNNPHNLNTISSNNLSQIKLVVSRAELSKQKTQEQLKSIPNTLYDDNNGEFSIIQHRQSGQMIVDSSSIPITTLKESHLNESSISSMPKTLKSGIFQKDWTGDHDDNDFARKTSVYRYSGETKLQKQHRSQYNLQKMPDIRLALRSKSPLQNKREQAATASQGFTKTNIKTLGVSSGRIQKSFGLQQKQKLESQQQTNYANLNKSQAQFAVKDSSFEKTSGVIDSEGPFSNSVSTIKAQQNQSKSIHENHVASLKNELRSLIDMEPYAHRARQLHATAQETSTLKHQDMNGREKMARKMTNKEIETWLSNTLEAQVLENEEEQHQLLKSLNQTDISTQEFMAKKYFKSPLINLEIDRIGLDKAGVDQANVDRIYKGLYAASAGIYDSLKIQLSNVHSDQRYRVLGNLWKAYQMLLQHCHPSEFKMIGQKLVEDQIVEINKVKEEYKRYKVDLDSTSIKQENELKDIQALYHEANEEKIQEHKRRQDSDRKLLNLQTKYEDEVRLRLDIEIKINKLHNLTKVMKNHEQTLNRKIEELEHTLQEFRSRCVQQEKEIVSLRTIKLQNEMTKQIDNVKIESVLENEMKTKERLISTNLHLQQKDRDLNKKINLNIQLQTVVDNRDSRIQALQDIVDINSRKDVEANAQYDQQQKQIKIQETAIEEYLSGMRKQDALLADSRHLVNETNFKQFEFEMAQSRQRDLEKQLDKLLVDTVDQRQIIEDYEEEISALKANNERLKESETEKIETIRDLEFKQNKLQNELDQAIFSKLELQKEVDQMFSQMSQKDQRYARMDNDADYLKSKVDDLQIHEEELQTELRLTRINEEQYQKASHLWEDKYHKSHMTQERAEKLVIVIKNEIQDVKKLQEDEKVIFNERLEDKITLIEGLRKIGDDVTLQLSQYKLRHMRCSIKAKLLQWILHTYVNQYCIVEHSHLVSKLQEMQQERETKDRQQYKSSKWKDKCIEMDNFEKEDLRARSIMIIAEKDKIIQQDYVIIDNQKGKIFMLNNELTIKEQVCETQLNQIAEQLKEIQSFKDKIEEHKIKSEKQKKIFIDKIDDQGSKIKKLTLAASQQEANTKNLNSHEVAVQTDKNISVVAPLSIKNYVSTQTEGPPQVEQTYIKSPLLDAISKQSTQHLNDDLFNPVSNPQQNLKKQTRSQFQSKKTSYEAQRDDRSAIISGSSLLKKTPNTSVVNSSLARTNSILHNNLQNGGGSRVLMTQSNQSQQQQQPPLGNQGGTHYTHKTLDSSKLVNNTFVNATTDAVVNQNASQQELRSSNEQLLDYRQNQVSSTVIDGYEQLVKSPIYDSRSGNSQEIQGKQQLQQQQVQQIMQYKLDSGVSKSTLGMLERSNSQSKQEDIITESRSISPSMQRGSFEYHTKTTNNDRVSVYQQLSHSSRRDQSEKTANQQQVMLLPNEEQQDRAAEAQMDDYLDTHSQLDEVRTAAPAKRQQTPEAITIHQQSIQQNSFNANLQQEHRQNYQTNEQYQAALLSQQPNEIQRQHQGSAQAQPKRPARSQIKGLLRSAYNRPPPQ